MNAGTRWICVVACSLAATLGIADSPVPKGSMRDNLDAAVASILDDPLAESDYGERLRCLDTGSYQSVEVLDTGHLLFWGNRGRVWLNQLRAGCAGLTNQKVLQFDMTGRSLCAMDSFHALDRSGRTGITGGMCGLQRFESITENQAKLLKDALARRTRSPLYVPKPAPASTDE